MTDRCIVCPCEDVTDKDVAGALALGHADLESIKRYTGIATGPCQGKQCLMACRELLRDMAGKSFEEIGTIVHRPPVAPLPLGLLAGEIEGERR